MEFVLVTQPRPSVTLVTLDRSAKRNALSIALMVELAAVLDRAAADDEVRCVVLTGDARAFSAGADINDQLERGLDAVFADERLDAWRTVERFPKPLVAAVEGYALGGGCELALLADIVIAGETARFGQPEINIGIFPGDGATQRLPRSVGKSMAMKMILSGEMIDAAEAKAIGLVAEVTAAGKAVDRALDLAAVIAEKGPIALRLAKEAVLTAFEKPLAAGLDFERRNLALAFDSDDQEEGMRAFVEKTQTPLQRNVMDPPGKVIVVGAGIVGVCCASYLQRQGHDVALIERGAPGEGCSLGNSGGFGVGLAAPIATPGLILRLPRLLLDPRQPLSVAPGQFVRLLPWFARLLAASRPGRVAEIAAARHRLSAQAFAAFDPLLEDAGARSLVRRDGMLFVYESRRSLEPGPLRIGTSPATLASSSTRLTAPKHVKSSRRWALTSATASSSPTTATRSTPCAWCGS